MKGQTSRTLIARLLIVLSLILLNGQMAPANVARCAPAHGQPLAAETDGHSPDHQHAAVPCCCTMPCVVAVLPAPLFVPARLRPVRPLVASALVLKGVARPPLDRPPRLVDPA